MTNSIRTKPLKKVEIVPLSYDFHFIRVFGSKDNLVITEHFISDYYSIPLKDVSWTPSNFAERY